MISPAEALRRYREVAELIEQGAVRAFVAKANSDEFVVEIKFEPIEDEL